MEEEERDTYEFNRVDTLHHDVRIPLSAKSGEDFTVVHDGLKTVKVPKGTSGKTIRIRMVRQAEL